MKGRKGSFKCKFAADGDSYGGEWHWTENGKPHAYAAHLRRIA